MQLTRLALASIVLILIACGPNTPSDAPDARDAILIALKTFDGDPAHLPELASTLLELPGVASAEVDAETGDAILGTFEGGRPFTVLANRAPSVTALPLAARALTTYTALPHDSVAVVMNGFGNAFFDPRPELTRIFGAAQFTTRVGAASLPELRNPATFAGASVVYVDSHGAPYTTRSGKKFALWTSTCDTGTRSPALMDGDLDGDDPRVVTLFATNSIRGGPSPCAQDADGYEAHFGVTAAFVRAHVALKKDETMVFLDTCYGQASWAQGFEDALYAKGATVYAGWTRSADDAVTPVVAPYFFDRLLGANAFTHPADARYAPESPPQRAFGWDLVFADMEHRGLTVSPGTGANLRISTNPASAPNIVGLLDPSLSQAFVLDAGEARHLAVHGWFSDPHGPVADAKVTLAGTELRIMERVNSQVIVELPMAPFAGEVVLEVNGRKSNPRMITEWRGVLEVQSSTPVGNGTIERRWRVAVHTRQDVGTARKKPHEVPVQANATWFASSDSTVTYEVSGGWSDNSTSCTVTRDGAVAATTPLSEWGYVNGVIFVDPIVGNHDRSSYGFDLGRDHADQVSCTGGAPHTIRAELDSADVNGMPLPMTTEGARMAADPVVRLESDGRELRATLTLNAVAATVLAEDAAR